jgi:hypothetical protein
MEANIKTHNVHFLGDTVCPPELRPPMEERLCLVDAPDAFVDFPRHFAVTATATRTTDNGTADCGTSRLSTATYWLP